MHTDTHTLIWGGTHDNLLSVYLYEGTEHLLHYLCIFSIGQRAISSFYLKISLQIEHRNYFHFPSIPLYLP
jgi:hypothetical protein